MVKVSREFSYIPNAVVRQVLDPAKAVEIARETLLQHARGAVTWADYRQMDMPGSGSAARFKVKGCVLHEPGVAGFRVLAINRTSKGNAMASHKPMRNIVLCDAATGETFGIVDERWSYAMRTGACGAVAIDALRLPNSRDCAILGTNHVAYAAAVTLHSVRPLERIVVFSRAQDNREQFAHRLSRELGVEAVAAQSPQECVKDASAVLSATGATAPIVEAQWLRPGVVVYAMGGDQEFDLECYRSMRLIVDDREQVKICREIHRWILAGTYDETEVEADLAEIVSGRVQGRRDEQDQFFIRSQGLVTQDIAQALWVYQEALSRGLGVSLEGALPERAGDPLY